MNTTEIITKIEEEINTDIEKIINKLNSEKLLLYLLIQQEIMFSTLKNEQPEYKEKLSESFSYVINLIKHKKNTRSNKLKKFDITKYIDLKKKYLEQLFSLLLTKSKINDFKVYINKQGYKLHFKNNILSISHEIKDYIKYYKLGYLRNIIGDMFLSMMSITNNDSNFIKVAQKAFEKQIDFFEIIDKGTSIERIRFLFSNHLCNLVININDANWEYRLNSSFNNYFSNSNININDKCSKSTNIRWIDLLKLTTGISNISIFMDNTIKEQCINNNIMFNNSIIFPVLDNQLFELFQLIFNEINKNITDDDIKQFIEKFTTDFTTSKINDKIDIQFKPFLKINDNFNFLLFRTFGATNLIRAYLSNHQSGLDEEGDKFEEVVKNTFLKCFTKVKDNINFKYNNEKGEIDICVLGENNIYFIECKNRLHPISASSSINNYEYIMKASQKQLPKAINYFNNDRVGFVKKYFNETITNLDDITIHKIVMLSNRNLAGLNFDDIAVRDIYSLERILETGSVNIGYASSNDNKAFEESSETIHFWENKISFQEIDLLNYLSNNSVFFKYLEDNIAIEQTRKHYYKQYTFEDTVFAYEAYKKE